MANTHLSAPWETLQHMITKLFEYDPEVEVEYVESTYTINIYVDNLRKADALRRLLPTYKEYGNITVAINVIPVDEKDSNTILFQRAFEGNKAVACFYTGCGPTKNITYISFQPIVVQFFNDQMDDINGLKSILYADIAKEVFGSPNSIFFCTEALAEDIEIPF